MIGHREKNTETLDRSRVLFPARARCADFVCTACNNFDKNTKLNLPPFIGFYFKGAHRIAIKAEAFNVCSDEKQVYVVIIVIQNQKNRPSILQAISNL